ncbi:class F sortase [Streptomyces sp. MP131-18]|uniref:class F sortase n=1 Tax=Streptomyces sp. MP131-18 TaxID=1857892 RepID=UPI0009A163C8|nr:class F sortase [Streptomyces sp. MP131-18]ONK16202.1 Sortase (surface protein transpeptidase) [Streptomyces sp. MP131-18]
MRLPEQPEYIADDHPYDDDPAGDRSGWGLRAALAVMAGTVALGISIMAAGTGGQAPPPQPEDVRREAGAAGGRAGAVDPLPPAVPTWVSIPSIEVEAPLMNVGLDPEGWVEAPPQEIANLAGWYEDAAAPGARGTAVIVGHVDNAAGPAVFYGLGVLRPGDAVEVIREDGVAVAFTVYDVAVYDKDQVPPSVYHDTGRAELRLITCGGSFEQSSGYEDNVVVYARMTDAG